MTGAPPRRAPPACRCAQASVCAAGQRAAGRTRVHAFSPYSVGLAFAKGAARQRARARRASRLCEPYITPTQLRSAFGEQAGEAAPKFLEAGPHGRSRFRGAFARCPAAAAPDTQPSARSCGLSPGPRPSTQRPAAESAPGAQRGQPGEHRGAARLAGLAGGGVCGHARRPSPAAPERRAAAPCGLARPVLPGAFAGLLSPRVMRLSPSCGRHWQGALQPMSDALQPFICTPWAGCACSLPGHLPPSPYVRPAAARGGRLAMRAQATQRARARCHARMRGPRSAST